MCLVIYEYNLKILAIGLMMLDFLSHSLIKSLFKTWITSLICLSPILYIKGKMEKPSLQYVLQSNLAIRNSLIRNKLVLRNHFLWPICHLLHKDKELLALRNNFRATKKFLVAKFDCTFLLNVLYMKIFPNLCSAI